MDEVSTDTNLAKLQLQRAEENQRLAKLELRRSMEILDRHTISSPIRGVVVQRFLAPGESVKDVPILRIAQIDPLRVEVIVPVSEFGAIKAGQSAIVHPEAPMQGNYAALVTIVDRVADAASGTFRVRLSMPNPDYALPSGLKCGVKFLPLAPETDKQLTADARNKPRLTADSEVAGSGSVSDKKRTTAQVFDLESQNAVQRQPASRD
jgi:multidrug efflux pump subunit AcrA (membrane-fusion protein)